MNRPAGLFPNARRGGRLGFALVLVLCFVLLLSVAILAYLSRALLGHQVSSSSANQTRVDLFAQGAADTLLGDLKQEIVAGSTATTVPSAGGSVTLYTPRAATNAVPALVGTATTLPNLLKTSAAAPFYPGGPTRATSESTANPSLNGRLVSAARWNAPLLLPKASAGNTSDLTPIAAFVPPNWVLVARDGSNPMSLADATSVVGRYAYAIYDEGGLLDVNVAGHPSSATTLQTSNHLGLAYADLKQIPGLTDSVIDALVGWRNYASAQPAGTFPNFNFGANATTNFFTSVMANTTGFLTAANTSLHQGGSDQKFVSRQQLLDFFNNGLDALHNAALQGSLQYLGTFSRDLNQPSYAPPTGRPHIADNDSLGNANAGNNSTGQDDLFNPPFLSIRVASSFTRNDGSMAVVGEPLVKKRFALNRLAWLTYRGPSATRSQGDPDMQQLLAHGITTAFLQQGTTDNIKNYFGLTWNGDYWTYDHGVTGGAGQKIIGYLAKVRDAQPPREPDFFELLKAALTAGSLGKGVTTPSGRDPSDPNNSYRMEEASAYTYDTTLDYQVLQIGANIIDQFDTDGYPTRIRFNNGTLTEVRGVENLPYFYRIRSSIITSGMPLPAPSATVVNTTSNTSADTWTKQTDLSDTGSYAVLWQPEVWNPHDANSSLGNPRPTNFRIVADGAPLDANGNAIGSYNVNYVDTQDLITGSPANGRNHAIPPSLLAPSLGGTMDLTKTPPSSYYTISPQTPIQWTGANTALTFIDADGTLFREPTLLTQPGIPNGSNLALGAGNIISDIYGTASTPNLHTYWTTNDKGGGIACLNDVYHTPSAVPYIGFYYGSGPLRWVAGPYTDKSTPPQTFYYVMSADLSLANTLNGSATADTIRVQYGDGGNWVTYDQKYIPNVNQQSSMCVRSDNKPDLSYNFAIGGYEWVTSPDPRTRRFGNPGAGNRGNLSALSNYPRNIKAPTGTPPPDDLTGLNANASFWVDELNNVLVSDRWGTSSGFGWWSPQTTHGLASVGGWFPNPNSNWLSNGSSAPTSSSSVPMLYRPGLLSQNNPAARSNGMAWNNQQDLPVSAQYFADPDGVVRRAMGGYVPAGGGPPATTTIGLPMATTGGPAAVSNQSQSRPIILNRPFRSVAELGYVFSDTPWRNLDMSTPESGAAALLDVFCIQPNDNPNPLVAGKVDLNTRQEPVLQALLAGSYADELNAVAPMPASEAAAVAHLLVTRTSDTVTAGKGPLANLADLVGRYTSTVAAPLGGIDGSKSYSGFSGDLSTLYSGSLADPVKNNIMRFREAAMRPLAGAGTVRVWNLLIDLVAQTGRYPQTAKGLSDFVVEGETRYWLHVAIDRETGTVIDRQLEVVRE